MQVEWTDELLTGYPDIDAKHREIFRQAAKFLKSGRKGKSKIELAEMLNFFELYVSDHFKMEEDLHLKYNYPQHNAHKAWHDDYRKQCLALREQYTAAGVEFQLAIKTIVFTIEWLSTHICNADKAFANYIRHGNLQTNDRTPLKAVPHANFRGEHNHPL